MGGSLCRGGAEQKREQQKNFVSPPRGHPRPRARRPSTKMHFLPHLQIRTKYLPLHRHSSYPVAPLSYICMYEHKVAATIYDSYARCALAIYGAQVTAQVFTGNTEN